METNKKILLTGATGFVGQHILNTIIKNNFQVIVVVREQKYEQVKLIPGIDEVIVTNDAFSESIEWWTKVCKEVDIIIHAAWYLEPGKYINSTLNLDCLTGTLNLAKAAVNAGVKKFVGLGTCFEYDLNAGLISTNTPLKPTNLYSSTKAATYFTLSNFFKLNSINFLWCRLFYLYGDGEDSRRLVAYVKSKIQSREIVELTSGKQIRDFLDVIDAAKIIVKMASSNLNGPANVCSGVPVSIMQFVQQISDEFAGRHLLKFGAREDNEFDPPFVVGVPTLT
jgi:nucleoside-diphosphate-sugar epimerase